MTEKFTNEEIAYFGDDYTDSRFEELLDTTDASEIHAAGQRVEELMRQQELTESERKECLFNAFALSGNSNIDADTADILMAMYSAGVTLLGMHLASNVALDSGYYSYLAESDNDEQRMTVASNARITAPLLAKLLKDECMTVVLIALDHIHTSSEMMDIADPGILSIFLKYKANQVREIRNARTEEDFDECANPWLDTRLSEAYAHNAHSPESIIRTLEEEGSVAGFLVRQYLEENHYQFQKEESAE